MRGENIQIKTNIAKAIKNMVKKDLSLDLLSTCLNFLSAILLEITSSKSSFLNSLETLTPSSL